MKTKKEFYELKDVLAANAEPSLSPKEALRLEVLEKLKKLKIKTIHCSYSGGGDEGSLNEILYMENTRKKYSSLHLVNLSDSAPKLIENIEEVLYDILENEVSGWEINDGGHGDIYWDIKPNKIKLCHHQCYTETIYNEREGL